MDKIDSFGLKIRNLYRENEILTKKEKKKLNKLKTKDDNKKNLNNDLLNFDNNDYKLNTNKEFCGYIDLVYKRNEYFSNFFGEEFIKKNNDNCILEIEEEYMTISEFSKNCKYNKNTLNIKILLKSNITDLSYMFYNCNSLKQINMFFINNEYNNIDNLSYMFYNCEFLKEIPDLSLLDVSKIKDMSYMFYNCKSIKNFPNLYLWNINDNLISKNIYNKCNNINDFFLLLFLQKLNIPINEIEEKNFEDIVYENYDKILDHINSQEYKYFDIIKKNCFDKYMSEEKKNITNKDIIFIDALYNSWKYIFNNNQNPINGKNIKEIHDISIEKVKKLKKNANDYRENNSKMFIEDDFENFEKLNNERELLIKNNWGDKYCLNFKYIRNNKLSYNNFLYFEKSTKYRDFKKTKLKLYSEYILNFVIELYYYKVNELKESQIIEYLKNRNNKNINLYKEVDIKKYDILTPTNKIKKDKLNKKFNTSLLPENSSFYDKLLEIIATTCKIIMLSHFFYDGNKRIMNFVINMFFKENNIFPCVISDSLIFIKKTIPEIIEEIKKGQYKFVIDMLKM